MFYGVVVVVIISISRQSPHPIWIHPNNGRESKESTMSIADLRGFVLPPVQWYDPHLRDKFQINGFDSNSEIETIRKAFRLCATIHFNGYYEIV